MSLSLCFWILRLGVCIIKSELMLLFHSLQCFSATASAGSEYDNPKVKPSASANAIYSLAARYMLCTFI